MRQARQLHPTTPFAADDFSAGDGLRLVQRAPGPEAPDARDKGGAQMGMLILLTAGAAFWAGVAALAVHYLR
jgi:hypothetical protein